MLEKIINFIFWCGLLTDFIVPVHNGLHFAVKTAPVPSPRHRRRFELGRPHDAIQRDALVVAAVVWQVVCKAPIESPASGMKERLIKETYG
jgi:hypothetical protein